MNMQTTSRLTAAEAALIEAFNNQIGELPGDGAVIAIRDRLLDDLKKGGLPTRRVEAWHYTDLKTCCRAIPAQAGDAGVRKRREPLVEEAPVLAVDPGYGRSPSQAVDGLDISAYSAQLLDGTAAAGLGALGQRRCGRTDQRQLRTRRLCHRRTCRDRSLKEPLEIQFVHAGGQAHTRLPVSFGSAVQGDGNRASPSGDAGRSACVPRQ